jgi:ribosomal protein L44E
LSEHYTRNTLECTVWCKRCNAMTQHRVDTGRRGPCLPCMEKQKANIEVERIRRGLAEEARVEKEKREPKLFES